MNPKATICITTYNRSETLKTKSLPSALEQKCRYPFEVIVIDDCSTDGTKEVAEDFKKQYPDLRYHRHENNRGLAAARNTGVSLAKGQFIVFLDDDDVLIPYVLEVGTILLEEMPDKQVVIGGRMVVYPEASQYHQPPVPTAKTFYTTLDDGFVIRKEVFDKIQYDETLLTNEDADFGIQFMQKYGHASIIPVNNCFLIKYGHEVGSPSSWSSPSKRTYLGMERYMEKNFPLYKKYAAKEEQEYILRYMGRLYCQGGQMRKGIPYLWRACKVKPMKKNIPLLLFALAGPRIFNWFWRQVVISSRTRTL